MNGVQNYVTNLKRSKQLSRRYTVQDRPPCANTKKKKKKKERGKQIRTLKINKQRTKATLKNLLNPP